MAGETFEQTETSASGLRMVLTMASIGLISGLLIVFTFQTTKPLIEQNEARALEEAIFEVVPMAESKKVFTQANGQLQPASGDTAGKRYYVCYTNGELAGVAVEASGQGFQEEIRLLYGYSPERDCVIGMKILASKETPGLGDKIAFDPDFLSNFECLKVELGPNKQDILNPIVLVPEGEKTEPYQIDAITGATISSRAVATILRDSTAEVVPLVEQNLDRLREDSS